MRYSRFPPRATRVSMAQARRRKDAINGTLLGIAAIVILFGFTVGAFGIEHWWKAQTCKWGPIEVTPMQILPAADQPYGLS